MIPPLLLSLFVTWADWKPYPLPGQDYNITNYTSMVGYAQTVTSGMFGIFLVIMIYVITFVITSRRMVPGVSFVIASYFTLMMSVMLRIMNLVNDQLVLLLIVLTVGSTIALTLYKRD